MHPAAVLQGVDNVYTQHQPLLSETLRLLAANDLNAAAYPYMAGSQVRSAGLLLPRLVGRDDPCCSVLGVLQNAVVGCAATAALVACTWREM